MFISDNVDSGLAFAAIKGTRGLPESCGCRDTSVFESAESELQKNRAKGVLSGGLLMTKPTSCTVATAVFTFAVYECGFVAKV